MYPTSKQLTLAANLGIDTAGMDKKQLSDAISKALDREKTAKPTNTSEAPEIPKNTGYHLTPEQCRSNALDAAFKHISGKEAHVLAPEGVIRLAKEFEQYIVEG